MTEEEKQEVAAFRFSVIHDLLDPNKLEYGEQERLLAEKCGRQWTIPYSPRTSLGKSTILSWVKAYMKGGRRLQSLYPQSRCDNGTARRYDKDTCLSLIRLRKEMPTLSVPNFIKEVKTRKLLPAEIELKRTTLYRFFSPGRDHDSKTVSWRGQKKV